MTTSAQIERAIKAYRKQYPEAEVSVVVRDGEYQVVGTKPDGEGAVTLDKIDWNNS